MLSRAVHPGIVLKEELEELGVSPMELARQIDVPPNRSGQIIAGPVQSRVLRQLFPNGSLDSRA